MRKILVYIILTVFFMGTMPATNAQPIPGLPGGGAPDLTPVLTSIDGLSTSISSIGTAINTHAPGAIGAINNMSTSIASLSNAYNRPGGLHDQIDRAMDIGETITDPGKMFLLALATGAGAAMGGAIVSLGIAGAEELIDYLTTDIRKMNFTKFQASINGLRKTHDMLQKLDAAHRDVSKTVRTLERDEFRKFAGMSKRERKMEFDKYKKDLCSKGLLDKNTEITLAILSDTLDNYDMTVKNLKLQLCTLTTEFANTKILFKNKLDQIRGYYDEGTREYFLEKLSEDAEKAMDVQIKEIRNSTGLVKANSVVVSCVGDKLVKKWNSRGYECRKFDKRVCMKRSELDRMISRLRVQKDELEGDFLHNQPNISREEFRFATRHKPRDYFYGCIMKCSQPVTKVIENLECPPYDRKCKNLRERIQKKFKSCLRKTSVNYNYTDRSGKKRVWRANRFEFEKFKTDVEIARIKKTFHTKVALYEKQLEELNNSITEMYRQNMFYKPIEEIRKEYLDSLGKDMCEIK